MFPQPPTDEPPVKKFLERGVGYLVTGLFVLGCYAIAHYMLQASDQTIMIFALWLLWSGMAAFVNKDDDAKASTK